MGFQRKAIPSVTGEGELRWVSETATVRYDISGEPSSLRSGTARMRGFFTATPEVAEAAFRKGDCTLVLESGVQYRLSILAYTGGSDVAYFEMRV